MFAHEHTLAPKRKMVAKGRPIRVEHMRILRLFVKLDRTNERLLKRGVERIGDDGAVDVQEQRHVCLQYRKM